MVKYSAAAPERAFKALAHPVRREMVERLARDGPLSVSDIARPFRISLPAALRHARVLERGGIVKLAKHGRVRTCAINMQSFDNLSKWIHAQRAFWHASFARLDRHLHSSQT